MAERGSRPAFLPASPATDVRVRSTSRWRRVLDSPVAVVALLAVATAILAGGGAGAYEYSRPTTYRSDAVLLIDQPAAIAISGSDGVILKLARLKVKYVGIISSQAFQQPVSDVTGMPLATVHSALQATNDPTSLLLHVDATMADAADAQRLAEAAARELVVYTRQEQTEARVPNVEQVTFTIVTPATPAVRVTPDRQRAALVGLFTFVAVLIVGALVADLLRRRYQRPG
jgi:uncharacterized protein involved in exopolysaccharide biosynthesis